MAQKFAEGMRGGVPPWKEGETIDLRVAHWCLFAPHASGMYETVRELVTAENQIEGVLAGMCETPGPGAGKSAMERAAEGGRVDPMHPDFRTQDWGWGLKYPDIHVVHTTLFDRIGELEPKVFFAHGCFFREQLIRMADGSSKPIHAVRKGDWVLSYNHEFDRIETKKVLWAGKNGTSKKWIRVISEHGPIQMPTRDHPFYLWEGQKIAAGNLKVGDELIGLKPVLSNLQREIILGKILGDGHYHHDGVEWSHKKEHEGYTHLLLKLFKGYTHWIAEQVSGYGSLICRARISLGTGFRDINPLRELKDLCYSDGVKVISDEFLESFSWRSLAILYYDDGSLMTQDYEKKNGDVSHYFTGVSFALCDFDEDDVKHIADYFTKKFGIKFLTNNYDYPRMHIYGKENLKKFFTHIIRQFPIPSCMAYKIPEEYRQGGIPILEDEVHFETFPNRILEINEEKPFPKYQKGGEYARWAITVEDNHNYYAGLNLVGNTPEACLENDLMPNLKSDSYGPGIRYIERCDATIVTSKRQELLWSPYDHSGDKIHRVDKGIDLEWWRKTFVKQELPGEPSVLYGEIWRGIKHPFHILFAVNEIYKRNPKVKLNAWGCNIKKPFWQKLFEESNFDNFLGPRGIKDIVDYPEHYYSRGDVLANPVIYGDVTRVGQEALACGCPNVAWDTDPFGDTHAYATAKAFDISDFAAKIEEIYEDLLDDGEAVHKKAREIAETHFDINVEAKQVVEILRKTVGET